MLSGPTGQTDYFSESFRGFPTPNESSLRTGLTPGGGGSMFPAHSPNSQAIFNLQGAGVTPGTGDFQATAMRAAAQTNHGKSATSGAPTSQPEGVTAGMDRQNNFQPPQPQQPRSQTDAYPNHDVSSAANDLLSFASQNGGGSRHNQPQFSMPSQPQSMNAGHMPVQPVNHNNHNRRDTKGSINSMHSAENGEFSESGQSEQAKTATRSRAKKGAANGKQAAGAKRKADEGPKGSRKKSAAAQAMDDDMMGPDSDEDMDIKDEDTHKDGRKMTDEEKRKNFLERNRCAIPRSIRVSRN
jgi:ATF/CREB family transcription factor